MDNRNIKIIDENNIDRNGKVICGFTDNGNNYVLYYIGRDEDNDNLFVSKVINKLDGTSNMINIDDNNEKERIDDIARKLVRYSIDTDADILNEKTVSIDGKTININGVIFNKEQSINVPKTYVATVKKSVSKVAYDFFKTNELNNNIDNVFNKNDNSIFANFGVDSVVEETNESTIVNAITEPVHEEVKTEEVASAKDDTVLEVPKDLLVDAKKEEKVVETPIESVKYEEKIPEVSPVSLEAETSPAVEPILPVADSVEVKPVEAPIEPKKPETIPNPIVDSKPVGTPLPVSDESKTEPIPVSPISAVSSVTPVNNVETEPVFFDGSKETNLNNALNEVSTDKVVSSEASDVNSLRDFGTSDKDLKNEPSVENKAVEAPVEAKKLTRSKGFANNKFFTIVAIILFAAACCFLGYEAFKYFTMTK